MAAPYIFLLEHDGKKVKLELNAQTTTHDDFLNLVKSRCAITSNFHVEFFDKDFEEWILVDKQQFDNLPDKSKLRTVIASSTPQEKPVDNAVRAPPEPDEEEIVCKYDIFVSHKQTTGKYLAQSVKHEVSQKVPFPLEWWIDVDRLDDLHNLTEFVRDSKNFMLLITPGVFESYWCLEEIRAALKYKKNLILVIDEGVPFPKVDELPEDVQPIFKKCLAITYYNQKQHRDVSIQDIIKKLKTRIVLAADTPTDTPDPEIAQGKPVVCSGVHVNPVTYRPENMVDGNENTRWAGAPGGKACWIYIDLGARYRITAASIKFEWAYGKHFFLEVEADKTPTEWKPAVECRGHEGWNHYDLRDSSLAVGRYLRIHLQEGGTPDAGMSIWLAKIYGHKV